MEEQERYLSSWKEIADFLGVTSRTAQEYEKTLGLPVVRLGRAVRITERELWGWQRTKAKPAFWARPRVLRAWAVGATALSAVLGLALAWVAWPVQVGPAEYIEWHGKAAVGVAAGGREVWRHEFDYPVMPAMAGAMTDFTWFGDMDGDGKVETLVSPRHNRREEFGWRLYCLSAKGQVLWQAAPEESVWLGQKEYRPPYVMRQFSVFASPEGDGTSWVAAVFVHHMASPAVLMVLDSKGKRRGSYWHFGHLNTVKVASLEGNGPVRLYAGGVSHEAGGARLLVFDPRRVEGSSNMEESPVERRWRGMDAGSELASVDFPRTGLNQALEQFNIVGIVDKVGAGLQVTVVENANPEGYLVYTLDERLRVVGMLPSISYQNAVHLFEKRDWADSKAFGEMKELGGRVRVKWR